MSISRWTCHALSQPHRWAGFGAYCPLPMAWYASRNPFDSPAAHRSCTALRLQFCYIYRHRNPFSRDTQMEACAQNGSRAEPIHRETGCRAHADAFCRRGRPEGRVRPARMALVVARGHIPDPARMPRSDMLDRDGENVLRAEPSGLEKRDLDVWGSGNTVTVKGQSRRDKWKEQDNYFWQEISQEELSRTMTLPARRRRGQGARRSRIACPNAHRLNGRPTSAAASRSNNRRCQAGRVTYQESAPKASPGMK